MNIEEFIAKVRSCKSMSKMTGQISCKVITNPEQTRKRIFKDCKCESCGCSEKKGITVYFKQFQQLTIFQAEMLFAVFYLGKKPIDYAQYHKCPAGQKFIDNIERIEV